MNTTVPVIRHRSCRHILSTNNSSFSFLNFFSLPLPVPLLARLFFSTSSSTTPSPHASLPTIRPLHHYNDNEASHPSLRVRFSQNTGRLFSTAATTTTTGRESASQPQATLTNADNTKEEEEMMMKKKRASNSTRQFWEYFVSQQQQQQQQNETPTTTTATTETTESATTQNNNNKKKKKHQRKSSSSSSSIARIPNGFWSDKHNQRLFLDWAGLQLNVHKLDDWYDVTVRQLQKLGGTRLLIRHYNASLIRALASVYPEHEWLPWKFRAAPMGFWDDAANHRLFFDWAGQQLGVRQLDDWYEHVIEDIHKLGGGALIYNRYDNSLQHALASVYPEHEWLPWRFTSVPNGFWKDTANHRRFLDWAAKQLGFDPNKFEGWYAVRRDDVHALGGHRLLHHHYGNSLIRALSVVYPEHEWEPWRFKYCVLGKDELVDERTLRRFVEGTLAPHFQVSKLEDWYRVSTRSARKMVDGYTTVIERHGGLPAVLMRLYPEQQWDEQRLRANYKRASQRKLMLAIQQLLPGEDVIEEYSHPGLRFLRSSEAKMTLDIWVPSLSLALEYQGEQHYRDVHALGDNASRQQNRDQEKAEECTRAGITLVAVPYWWRDKCSVEDLAATITAARPDLLQSHPTIAEAARKGKHIAAAAAAANNQ